MIGKSGFKRLILKVFSICLVIVSFMILALPVSAKPPMPVPPNPGPAVLVIAPGQIYEIGETIRLNKLIIGEGANIVAPEGYSVTLTVNGVETGQALVTTAGVDTAFLPGVYLGDIVLTVTEENQVPYAMGGGPPGSPPPDPLYFPFRQAIFLNDDGIIDAKSVLAAVIGKKIKGDLLNNIQIRSTGECFNGLFVESGEYEIKNLKVDFEGNGRSDFIGYGAAVTSRGENTVLVLDGARIVTDGVVRSAVVADQGCNLIVKNSYIQTYDGVLPEDYVPTIDTSQMRSVPWMLSLSGNCRATNLLGTNTRAAYINSYIGAEGWGVLSTDGCTTPQLTAINSTIAITGPDGYGSYGIGNATERFLGCTFNVATYATISRGSFLYYGDSDRETVAQLNDDLELGLTSKELKMIRPKNTVVNSERFGIMWHGGGTLDISGGTVFNTKETTFLDKGQAISITVDGSEGARLNPMNGVIFQLMDDDDPGPVPPDMTNTGVYTEPTGAVTPQAGHDVTVADDTDALVSFTDIKLKGDFYNGMRGDIPGMFGPANPRNLEITFNQSMIMGMITASTALHNIDTITADEYYELGEVTNTPSEAVNNGVLVYLENNSKWTVTGDCYLTVLDIEEGSIVEALPGHSVSMTVDGTPTDIVPGNYTGAIVLTVN